MHQPKNRSWFQQTQVGWLLLILGVGYCSLFFLQKINLQTADIGRHIVNGKVIVAEGLRSQVLSKNFYSYTAPDFTFINHHWLYGVLAYGQYRLGGFAGLMLMNTVIATLAIGIATLTAIRRAGKAAALVALLLSLPLLTQRTEVRPETLSLLFLASSLWLLHLFTSHKLRLRWLLTGQILISILWVNIHLFFILNLTILGITCLAALCSWLANRSKQKKFLLVGLITTTGVVALSLLLNPHGLAGVLTPFRIFAQYAYPVAENQSLWFYVFYYPKQPYPWYFAIVALILLASFLFHRRSRTVFTWVQDSLLSIAFVLAASSVTRLFPFFAVVILPILAWNLGPFITRALQQLRLLPTLAYVIISPVIFCTIILALASGIFIPRLPSSGIGELSGVQKAAEFYQKLHLTGPVFNNYDIGSYLIFHLFSLSQSHPVFIDNRPEDYPPALIRDQYIAAQENEETWQALLKQYDFETIFFYRHDATTWAQPFLIRRIQDPEWVPIYVDDFSLILIRQDPLHQSIIDTYKLPDDTFSLSS